MYGCWRHEVWEEVEVLDIEEGLEEPEEEVVVEEEAVSDPDGVVQALASGTLAKTAEDSRSFGNGMSMRRS
jgi:hypothetical protein